MIAGDFNCALDLVKDRSSGTIEAHRRSRAVTQHFMKESNLTEIWREENLFLFSGVHKSYSRTHFFLVSAELRHKVKGCFYDAILI